MKREIKDADGKDITVGTVLIHVDGKDRGVVTKICVGGESGPMLSSDGDLCIQTDYGCWRITNQYSKWRRIPQVDQTYEERYAAWNHVPYIHDEDRSISRDEGLAVSAIMSLLPETVVDDEYGPWGDDLEDATMLLMRHLTSLEKEIKRLKEKIV